MLIEPHFKDFKRVTTTEAEYLRVISCIFRGLHIHHTTFPKNKTKHNPQDTVIMIHSDYYFYITNELDRFFCFRYT